MTFFNLKGLANKCFVKDLKMKTIDLSVEKVVFLCFNVLNTQILR